MDFELTQAKCLEQGLGHESTSLPLGSFLLNDFFYLEDLFLAHHYPSSGRDPGEGEGQGDR